MDCCLLRGSAVPANETDPNIWGCGPCENWCACTEGDTCACLIDQDPSFCQNCKDIDFHQSECSMCRDYCEDACRVDPMSCECFIQHDPRFCLSCPSLGGRSGRQCGECDGACACLAEPNSC